MAAIDHTHDAGATSWVESANHDCDFPIQNLPLGIFDVGNEKRRAGVAIGDVIVDLEALLHDGTLSGDAARAVEATVQQGTLNGLFALGAVPRRALRLALFDLLTKDGFRGSVEPHLVDAGSVRMHVPATIGDYTDFFAGIHHATNVGKLFRPDNPLMANYKYVPIGYHGRASSIRPSGAKVRRPNGQVKRPEADKPVLMPSQRLDYEVELGAWVGPGNAIGAPIPIGEAASHLVGLSLLNDWSARDIQSWEYQPLGPFLAKSFSTTISPWVITAEALAPFRTEQARRPDGDPAPLAYLRDDADQAHGAYDIELEVRIQTKIMAARGLPPHRLGLSNARHMYWTIAQMLTHHTVAGCNLRPGDLLGTGTISAPDPSGYGSLLEVSQGGNQPVLLPSRESRRFLEDGDTIIMRGQCNRAGYAPIGFGDCVGEITSAE
jgi:fumarylacetoacetase